jgi:hypothetical protein
MWKGFLGGGSQIWMLAAMPPADSMPECDHCGAHVSERFARVFADEYGHVHACPACSANAGIAEVARQRAQQV